MTALRGYYLATPLFMLFDLVYGLNVRAVALDHLPGARWVYYAFCLGCAWVTLKRPGATRRVAEVESAVNISLLIAAVLLTYAHAIRALAYGTLAANPFTVRFLVNFVLSGTVWMTALYRSQLPERRARL